MTEQVPIIIHVVAKLYHSMLTGRCAVYNVWGEDWNRISVINRLKAIQIPLSLANDTDDSSNSCQFGVARYPFYRVWISYQKSLIKYHLRGSIKIRRVHSINPLKINHLCDFI